MKYILLTPAYFSNGVFATQCNENLDDIANAPMDYKVHFTIPYGKALYSNLTLQMFNYPKKVKPIL